VPESTSRPSRPSNVARGAHARELRIIAGAWRGRRWRFAEGEIRPTGDRVRETLFNWLQGRVAGRRCLDLYAGSGALGLEALSRGAAHCTFVDTNKNALAAIRALLVEWRAPAGAGDAVQAEARRFLAGAARPCDLVFLDPPFAAGELAGTIDTLERRGWLAADARIYIEQSASATLPALPPGWTLLRTGKAGAVGFHLCGREAARSET
jgi:16S rRNA (guanine966-N2)-methyltransferase